MNHAKDTSLRDMLDLVRYLVLSFSIHAGRRNGNDEISFLILTFSIHSDRGNGEISFSSLISPFIPLPKYIHHQNKASLENLMKRIRLTFQIRGWAGAERI